MKKLPICLMLSVFLFEIQVNVAWGQAYNKVTGTVVNSFNEPVKRALIFYDGTQTGFKTNKKGIYKIRVSDQTKTIAVFSKSEGSEEIRFTGQDTLDFVLSGSYNANITIKNESEEDLVDIGYGRAKRDNVSSSVGSVSKEKINYSSYSDIYSMIQVEVPGVTVSGENIIIRGIGTNSESMQPIFVVNGSVVYSISGIDPNFVQSIDILKGPAASIYGMNGANGVIIINLKKAESNE